ncbi:MAG: hypothetical protein OER21_09340 [Gemmatimonadota bacterium]|nr:hypothetical protein [Gemmatimonadota bacterium]
MEPFPHACPYVVGYETEPAGSDVADPRIRCGQPATVQLDDGARLCATHARLARAERDQQDGG